MTIKKEKYTKADIEIIRLNANDVILTSIGEDENDITLPEANLP